MLRRVAFTELPRDPQSVRVLHHAHGGVLIAAVTYRSHHHHHHSGNDATASSSSHPHGSPLFFTVVEMQAPNERGLPLRVVHVRVPRPCTAVHSITLLRSPDGADVFVVVQAAEEAAVPSTAPPNSVTTYVYRRQLVPASSGGAENEEGEEDGEDVVSSQHGSHAAGAVADLRVRYQRLPRTVVGADGPLWTAAAAFSTSEASIVGSAASAAAALVTVSETLSGESQLQLWSLTGTRVALAATCRLPALAGFPVSQVLTVPGTQDVVVLRCHNSLLEVDLAAMRRVCARYPHTATTNAVLTRAWRLSSHDRLTACTMKDALLYAGTDDGRVLVWDFRQAPTTAAGVSAPRASDAASAQPQCSVAMKTPITGLYAPYATGFVSCDASGAVRDWRDRAELADEEDGRNLANAGHDSGADAAIVDHSNEEEAMAGLVAAQFPYRARAPAEMPGVEVGCVAMDGHDNFAGVIGESGRLSVYFCS